MADQKDTYGAESKFTGVTMDPDKIIIVGHDTDEVDHPLCDPERLNTPPDEGLIQSIMTHGVKVPVLIRKDGDRVLAVDGRQRIRCAREANKRLRKAGADYLVKLKAVPEDKSNAAPELTKILANEFRREDSAMTKARNAAKLAGYGHTKEAICGCFGISPQTLGNWSRLLACTPEIQTKIEQGEIKPSLGYEIGKLPAKDQNAALASATEADPSVRGAGAVERIKAAGAGRAPSSVPKVWKASKIRDLMMRLGPSEGEVVEFADDNEEIAHALLKVLLGDDPTGKGLKEFPSVHKAVKKTASSETV